jgi:hypothetical protein
MIIPSSVQIVKGIDLVSITVPTQRSNPDASANVPPRVLRKDAVVDKSDKMCASGTSNQAHGPSLMPSMHSRLPNHMLQRSDLLPGT